MNGAAPVGLGALSSVPAGVAHYTLNLSGIDSKAELMAALQETLALPEHFGRNWDALYDLLTDLNTDMALTVQEQAVFAHHHAELWEALWGVLQDAQAFLARQGVQLWLLA